MDPTSQSTLEMGCRPRQRVSAPHQPQLQTSIIQFTHPTHPLTRSVNLGGLFVLEPFISPALYQPFNGTAVDEWSLSTLLGDDLQKTLENHYSTFITEEDIAEIAGAGLNWIRVPVPFWAIETWKDVGVDAQGRTVAEPFLERVCWKYILRVLGWARKYGLRVNLDLHAAPGSQNGQSSFLLLNA